ncbi:hypothetical protein HK102_012587 [Quaeritorhiza haematococci]|nr:hypothetical protein HK102_012587 [Quaeritorhiza haematococci]
MVNSLNIMTDTITKFEAVLYIPVPKSYDIHLKQILLLYFVAMPLQLVNLFGWLIVPFVVVISCAFLGADAIAAEIEDPFGTDQNDLPIDYFIRKLREDFEYIMNSSFRSSPAQSSVSS